MDKFKMNCGYCGRKCSLDKDFCIPQDSVYVCKSCYDWQQKIAELKAKLAEYKSKTRVAFSQLASFQLRYDDLKKEYKEQENLLEKTMAINSKLQLELDQLKQQLAEKDEYIKYNVPKLIEANEMMSKQLAEKEKEIDELRFRERNINGLIEQLPNQNQTAIDELEKVKELLKHKGFVLKVKPPIELPTIKGQEYLNQFYIFVEDFDRIFDQQIKELKGEK